MRKNAGQSLTEYTLIGLAIAVLLVPALTLLGKNINAQFQNMLASPGTFKAIATNNSQPGGSLGQSESGNSSQSLTVTLSNGKTITLSTYPKDIRNYVSTTGSNGGTEILANTLIATAEQLLAAGEMDKAQYNDLVALANQGHKIASIEKAVEDAAHNLPPGEKLSWETQVTWEGQQLTAYDLYLKIGYFYVTKNDLQTTGYLNETERAGTDVKQLQTLYQNALSSGALSDPSVQTLVSGLTTDIASMSYDFIVAMNQLVDGSLSPSQLNESLASQLTHSDSADICKTGSATDSGIQCSGS